jgi:hypothetical protein
VTSPRIMLTRSLASLGLVAAGTLLLSGCIYNPNISVPADKVAETAEDALEAEIGARPDIDCGTDLVGLVNGTKLDCLLIDPASGAEFDATVTIDDVDGTNYTVNVKVADTPNGEAPVEPEPETEPTPAAGSGELSVWDYELADLAEDALTDVYGARPTVLCDLGGQIPVAEGLEYTCEVVVAQSGARGVATITITSVEGTTYNIDVNVVDA